MKKAIKPRRYSVTCSHGILSICRRVKDTFPQPTVFLDRDGVLNRRIVGGYVLRWDDFVLLPGVLPALRDLKKAGFVLLIVSNQAAVAKRLLRWQDLASITKLSLKQFCSAGGEIDGAFFCLHHPSENCVCRKPRPGLLKHSCRYFNIDWNRSFLVGDS